jgi:cell division protein FtsW
MPAFSRTERGLLARWWWTVDHGLMTSIGLLAMSGLVFVLAASPPVAARLDLPAMHFVARHAMYLVPATLLLLGGSLLSPKGVLRVAVALLAISLVMLALTPLLGIETKGATRWLRVRAHDAGFQRRHWVGERPSL